MHSNRGKGGLKYFGWTFLVFFLICSDLFSQNTKIDSLIRASMFKEDIQQLVGQELPYFESGVLGEGNFSTDDLIGKPSLINLWFEECPPCIAELPLLNKLENEFANRVNFVAITFDKEEKVIKFLSQREFNYEHIINARSYLDTLGVKFYPKTLILDKQSKIVRILGKPFLSSCAIDDYMSCYDEFQNILSPLLE